MNRLASLPLLSAIATCACLVGCMPGNHRGAEHAGEAQEHAGETRDKAGHGHEEAPRHRRVRSPAVIDAAARVRVLARSDLKCRSEALGVIDVHESVGSTDQALNELKLRAAELGAEVVVGVDFEHGDGHEATHLSGMALRCRDLLRGRQYDVIANVDVPGEMGHEDEAFQRIKERARELHADLLIDVSFHHGEAGHGPTRLRAKAIRFRD